MRYSVLFQIEIVHPYFLDATADLIILPDAQTAKLLASQRFSIKRTTNGILILKVVNEAVLSLPMIAASVFVFTVFPTSNNVKELTDTSMVESGNMFLFSNEKISKGSLALTKSETLQKGNYQNFPAMARVEIKGKEITSQPNGLPPIYKVPFQSKKIKWKYYFVSNSHRTAIGIEARDSPFDFNELAISEDTSDKIINSLRINFQQDQIVVFESSTAIPYTSKPKKNINLMQNGAVLIKHLPNPTVEDQGIQIIKI